MMLFDVKCANTIFLFLYKATFCLSLTARSADVSGKYFGNIVMNTSTYMHHSTLFHLRNYRIWGFSKKRIDLVQLSKAAYEHEFADNNTSSTPVTAIRCDSFVIFMLFQA